MGIQVKAASDSATLYVYGGIAFPDDRGDVVDVEEFVSTVQAQTASQITVRLATIGGDPVAAGAMYQALVDHPARVRTVVDSKAYSAGSMVLQAGDERAARPLSMVMVHGPRIQPQSPKTSTELRQDADVVDAHIEMMVASYTRGGRISEETVRTWIGGKEEYYFSAKDALEAGLIDEIDEADISAPAAYAVAAMGMSIEAAKAAKQPEAPKMADPKTPAPPEGADDKATQVLAQYSQAEEHGKAEGTKAERDRIQKILAYKSRRMFAAPQVQAVLDTCIADGTVDPATAFERAVSAVEQLPQNAPLDGGQPLQDDGSPYEPAQVGASAFSHLGGFQNQPVAGKSQGEKTITAMVQATIGRMGVEKQDRANPYRGHSLLDLARACLAAAGHRVSGLSSNEIAGKVLSVQTTSDFHVVLENTMHKLVLDGFQAQPGTWRQFCKVGSVSDLRDWKRITPGLISDLTTQDEHGAYRAKPIPDGEAEPIAAELVGNIIGVTANVLINDDLNYIDMRARGIGSAGERTIERKVYLLLAANPTMSDGEALFSAAHANLADGTPVPVGGPSIDNVDQMAAAMAEQKAPAAKDDPDPSDQYLDLVPYAAVAHRHRRSALQVINGGTMNLVQAPNAATGTGLPFEGLFPDVNPMAGTFAQIATSVNAERDPWYIFADPGVAPVIEVVFLNGMQEPQVSMEQDFQTSGMRWKVELPHGVGAIGWRGCFKNPGA